MSRSLAKSFSLALFAIAFGEYLGPRQFPCSISQTGLCRPGYIQLDSPDADVTDSVLGCQLRSDRSSKTVTLSNYPGIRKFQLFLYRINELAIRKVRVTLLVA